MTDEELDAKIEAAVDRRLAKMREAAIAKAEAKKAELTEQAAAESARRAAPGKAMAANRRRLEQRTANPQVKLGGLARKGYEALGPEPFDALDSVEVTVGERFIILAGSREALTSVVGALREAAAKSEDPEAFRRAAKAVANCIGCRPSVLAP